MKTPYIPKSQKEIDNYPPFPFPLVGPFDIDGWVFERQFLVDNTNLGCVGEFALTMEQFKQQMEIGKGYGVIDCGKFQVIVGQYRRNP